MAYSKPNNFVDNNELTADDINGNDEELKKYINQEVLIGDLGPLKFSTEEFKLGEYQPITNNYDFVSGPATGNFTDDQQSKRAYWTSTIKKGRLTDNTLPVWTSLYHTSPEIYLERPAHMLITFGANTLSAENEVAANGFWDTTLKLAYRKDNGPLTFVEQSRAYSFEETDFTNTPSGNVNPFGATGTPNSSGAEAQGDAQNGLRRWIGWSCIINNALAGSYKFSVYANAKVEEGLLSARQFKAEVFYL
jgi:hypothetical protein